MKIIKRVTGLILFLICIASTKILAQGLINNGADIVTTSGSNIFISGTAGNYTSQANGIIKNDSGSVLTLTGNWFNNSANTGFVNNTSTIIFAGANSQNIGGSSLVSMGNVVIENASPSGVILNTGLNIYGSLTYSGTGENFSTNDSLTFKSTDSTTAFLGNMTGNTITGKATVERYIPTGTSHGKSWQLVAAPTNGQTIYNSWMEGGLTPAGYGTWITGAGGTAGGFDASSAAPSMKTYVPATDSWVTVTNPTTTAIHNDNGYMIFVRGDRSVVNAFGANSTAIPTNLRSKGILFTGTLPAIPVPIGEFQTLGNPYASRVDFRLLTKSNVDNVFYVWDPMLYGKDGFGGYQVLSGTNNYQPTSPSANYLLGVSYPYIESGQAFFVHNSSGLTGSVTFTESAKASGSHMVNRPFSALSQRQFFKVYLYDNSGNMVDGNVEAFDNGFLNAVDGDDAMKMANSGENFGIKRDGKILAVEARSPVTASDTVFYNLANFTSQTYRLHFAPQNMRGSGLSAYLVDKYLNTSTPVNLDDTSSIAITVNTDAASFAANRLMVVFSPMAPLPVTFTSVTARQVNNEITVEWQVENESNMKQYEVEKSLDGSSFTQAASIAAINGLSNNYQWIDQQPATGNNYYRIKSVDVNGKTNYTQIVKVSIENTGSGIAVYPNPISNGTINLKLNNQPAGVFIFQLTDPMGQIILKKEFVHKLNDNTETIMLENRLTNGFYQAQVTTPKNEVKIISILKL